MTHSTTYPFRRWYRRPLTPRESAVIGLLERRRRRTGRVSIVLTVSAAEHAAISRLLLHYALFLNNRCTLSCTLLVAPTGAPTAAGRLTPHSTLPTPNSTAHRATHSTLLTARSATNSSLRAPPAACFVRTVSCTSRRQSCTAAGHSRAVPRIASTGRTLRLLSGIPNALSR